MTFDRESLRALFGCIDHTSLNATDTPSTIERFCGETLQMTSKVGVSVAAVCVYPTLVSAAVRMMQGSGIAVASVACGFPSGQMPFNLKLDEVKYVLEAGADEVDMVISRGAVIEGEMTQVYDEVTAVRELCEGKKLKVILETGELKSEENIEKASLVALSAGADFIKTSTGKIPVGATVEAAEIMLKILTKESQNLKKLVGFKASGGISTVEEAMEYVELAKKYIGKQNINNQRFRIGASRLTTKVYQLLEEKN